MFLISSLLRSIIASALSALAEHQGKVQQLKKIFLR